MIPPPKRRHGARRPSQHGKLHSPRCFKYFYRPRTVGLWHWVYRIYWCMYIYIYMGKL